MKLTQNQQAVLAASIKSDPIQIIFGIMKDEAFNFNSELLLAKKPEDILQAHSLAAAAAQFHDRVISRIEEEIQQYTCSPSINDRPVDVTEGLLEFEEE